jgi:hypothetical protein
MAPTTRQAHAPAKYSHSAQRRDDPRATMIRRRATQRGGALVIVLFLSVTALALGLLSAVSARTELRIAHNDVLDLQAFNVAEAGINVAIKQIGNHSNFNDELASNTGGACNANGVGNSSSGIANIGSAATNASDGLCYRFASFGGTSSDGYYVRVTDNLDETSGGDVPTADTDGTIRLIVHGKVGTAERILTGTLSLNGWGVFGINTVALSGGSAEICSGNAVTCATGSSTARVGSNGNITGSGGATIMGSAYAGGTVTAATNLNVSGTSANNQTAVSFPSVTACSPYTSTTTGISPASAYNIATGVFSQGGGPTVTLAPGTYCFKSLNLQGGSTLSVSGATTINLTGDASNFVLNIQGGSIANTTSDPSNLVINSSANTPSGCSNCFLIDGGSQTYMKIYAPNTVVQFTGGGTVRGQIIGKEVYLSGNSNVMAYGVAGAALKNWHEVQN